MEAGVFDWLESLSPWWWVAFALALGAIEMATMSFFLIWPGLAALAMAGLLALFPGMPGEVQVAAFATLSVALTFGGRAWMRRYGDGGAPPSGLNDRSRQMIGRRGTVIRISQGEATVQVDGVHWRARLAGGAASSEPGAGIEVTGVDGMTLEVRSLPD